MLLLIRLHWLKIISERLKDIMRIPVKIPLSARFSYFKLLVCDFKPEPSEPSKIRVWPTGQQCDISWQTPFSSHLSALLISEKNKLTATEWTQHSTIWCWWSCYLKVPEIQIRSWPRVLCVLSLDILPMDFHWVLWFNLTSQSHAHL